MELSPNMASEKFNVKQHLEIINGVMVKQVEGKALDKDDLLLSINVLFMRALIILELTWGFTPERCFVARW